MNLKITKNLFYILAVALIGLSSCSKDEETTTAAVTTNELLGKWGSESATVSGTTQTYTTSSQFYVTVEFTADKMISTLPNLSTVPVSTDSYTVSGNTITVTKSDGSKDSLTYSISGGKLTATSTSGVVVYNKL